MASSRQLGFDLGMTTQKPMSDRDEALGDAVDLLRRREKLIADVNHGIEQIDRGETVPFDPSEMKTALRRVSQHPSPGGG
jgi:hypothetical protein